MIVQKLRAIQNKFGYLPDEELVKLANDTKTPLYRIQEVASFFPHFRQEWNKPPHVEVKVCRDMSCHLAGSAELLLAEDGLLELAQGKKPNGHGDHRVEIEGTSCLGRCDRAPAVCISRHVHKPGGGVDHTKSFHDRVYAGKSEAELKKILAAVIRGDEPPADTPDVPRPGDAPDLGRVIDHESWQIDTYFMNPALPPYAVTLAYLDNFSEPIEPPPGLKGRALSDHIKKNHPWLAKLDVAGLQGMGGAGVPAFSKWSDVWSADSKEKYIVCNGDESEPGTFKDRELLTHKAHLVVEGVILAGLMTGATKGFIYIRHEYREQINRCREEIERARAAGVCGNILDTGRTFDVEVFESPGGYICGEQSALIEAMEDKRSQPRNKPPELLVNGLYDKPTVVNNVETLAWVPVIMHRGGAWYADSGRPGFKGLRFFSISGDLNKPGVFEVENGITLGELIAQAGGMKGGDLKAVAFSGPSGGFIPTRVPVEPGVKKRLDRALGRFKNDKTGELSPEGVFLQQFAEQHLITGGNEQPFLDIRALPLDLNFFRSLGGLVGMPNGTEFMLGAGIVVYNSTRNMLIEARNCTQFFRNESCGKCVPCRIGSQKLVEISTELLRRRQPDALEMADDDGQKETNIPQPLLDNLSKNIGDFARYLQMTTICGLGYVAPGPLNTAVQFFKQDIGAVAGK